MTSSGGPALEIRPLAGPIRACARAARLEELDESRAGGRGARLTARARSAERSRATTRAGMVAALERLGFSVQLGSRRFDDPRRGTRRRDSRRAGGPLRRQRRHGGALPHGPRRARSRSLPDRWRSRACASGRSRICSMPCGCSAWRRAASTATAARPLVVEAAGLEGGATRVVGGVSSQFTSALLLVAPYARHDVRLDIDGPLVSAPFVDMTLALMGRFGVASVRHGTSIGVAAPQRYRAGQTVRSSPTLLPPRISLPPPLCSAERWWCTASAPNRCRATSGSWTCWLRWAPRCVSSRSA